MTGHTESALREEQLRLGLWMFLATVTMLFAAFTSAYIVRRSGTDWTRIVLPPILVRNSLVLAASSVALEVGVYVGARRRWRWALVLLVAALELGVGFLAGQVSAWRELAAAGVYLPSSPHSSFFFMLTGAHALHVAAALAVLAWGTWRTWRGPSSPAAWSASLGLCRTFWHYLGGVWLFLFALMAFF